jgi:hypothetical protein
MTTAERIAIQRREPIEEPIRKPVIGSAGAFLLSFSALDVAVITSGRTSFMSWLAESVLIVTSWDAGKIETPSELRNSKKANMVPRGELSGLRMMFTPVYKP